ncbi:MAG: metallophosphoesterase [Erysipelotrichaceae bacterium]|nr:metallophosphoesterase [Erysipelotrichaceae bacterium]
MTLSRFFWIGFLLIATIGLIHIIHALTLGLQVQTFHTSFTANKLREGDLRLLFLSDIHHFSLKKLKKELQKLTAPIDLILVGGDFPHTRLPEFLQLLKCVPAKWGIYGVEGNHDEFSFLQKRMPEAGTLLNNEGVMLREDFYLCGFRDPWHTQVDLEAALKNRKGEPFTLLLAHQPDQALEMALDQVDLMLAGHTHDGEIAFFGLWRPALTFMHVTSYNQHFRAGWRQGRNRLPVLVNSGLGCHLFRSFTRPQIIVLTIKKADQS